MQEQPQQKNSLVDYWIENLVGTGSRFFFNILISISGGVIYSFGLWPSPTLLILFGVVSPLLFTLCLYTLIKQFADLPDSPVPAIFSSQASNSIMMIADMVIIVVLATLIYTNVINFLFFRILQTIVFPVAMLFMLRIIFLSLNEDMD
jgi:hypothetical protein